MIATLAEALSRIADLGGPVALILGALSVLVSAAAWPLPWGRRRVFVLARRGGHAFAICSEGRRACFVRVPRA